MLGCLGVWFHSIPCLDLGKPLAEDQILRKNVKFGITLKRASSIILFSLSIKTQV